MNIPHDGIPHSSGQRFLTDSGLETTLVFLDGRDLPCFASFPLLETAEGRARIERYYREHMAVAMRHGAGFLFESITWRANPDWGTKLGYSAGELAEANREAVNLLAPLRRDFEAAGLPALVSGNIGPRGDGYSPGALMSRAEARDYHDWQIGIFQDLPVDLVSAFTINYANEATGIVQAARSRKIPVCISFTVETDGRLPSGQALGDAIEEVDSTTGKYARYFMLNCAHPEHFDGVISEAGTWLERIRGIRANASRQSHAELDSSTSLDAGDPQELGEQYRELAMKLPNLAVFVGCCGTDCRHVEAIAKWCLPVAGNA
jgi:S-methylmethionine-dependent homocysteine/selenocysteine methylase